MPPEGQDPTDGTDGQDPIAKPQVGAATADPSTPEPKAEAPQAGDDVVKELKVKKANEEAAASRIRAKNAEDALKKLQDTLKTADERNSERLKQLELAETTWRTRERALLLDNDIALAVADMNAHNSSLVADQLKKSSLLVIDDETGRPTSESIDAAKAATLTDMPYLFKQAGTEAPKATSAGAGINMQRKDSTVLTRAAIDKMSTDEINALYNSGELQKALAAGVLK